jgi:hypothetical protein
MSEQDPSLAHEQTPEQEAAEAAAFEASFNEARSEASPAASEHVEAGAAPAAPAGESAEPVEPAAAVVGEQPPAEEPAPAEEQKLFAGLTEEQIQAALARTSTLQGTVDKMAGRIGQLMQQIESLKANPPTTQAAQQALNLKLEKLSEAFPHLADLLREDLQALQGGGAPAENLAPEAPVGITQEQLDAMFAQRLGQTQEELREQMEVKVLSVLHPDWLDVIQTPQFALFRDNVLPRGVGQQLMESEDSAFISQKLTEFKEWRAKHATKRAETPPPNTPPVTPASPPPSARLKNAVLPTGSRNTNTSAAPSEEDAFEAAFRADRKKSGYN